MSSISVNGVRIGYDLRGSGPTVVFVHAGLTDRRSWEKQLDHFSQDHRVLSYDSRGHGESELGEGTYSPGRDLLALLDGLDIERAIVVGNSMGGGTALEAALLEPHRIESLVVAAPGLPGYQWPQSFIEQVRTRVHSQIDAERRKRYLEGRGEPGVQLDRDIAAYVRAHIEWMVAGPRRRADTLDPEVVAGVERMLGAHLRLTWSTPSTARVEPEVDVVNRLAEVTAPVLVVNGREDVPEIQEVGTAVSQSIAQANRVDLDDCGHLPGLERPERFNEVLTRFLASET
ncbi:alpha/beta fold hydrolase [Haloglycomyces albus]|uniref:alpha/beta fold hydrolase n=1 Tax=Haloglycomyces albus TaxID=526067 RepID=UPI00046D85B7|nr:alpha/beta hydrolase [Haloglycomyces albus]